MLYLSKKLRFLDSCFPTEAEDEFCENDNKHIPVPL